MQRHPPRHPPPCPKSGLYFSSHNVEIHTLLSACVVGGWLGQVLVEILTSTAAPLICRIKDARWGKNAFLINRNYRWGSLNRYSVESTSCIWTNKKYSKSSQEEGGHFFDRISLPRISHAQFIKNGASGCNEMFAKCYRNVKEDVTNCFKKIAQGKMSTKIWRVKVTAIMCSVLKMFNWSGK